VHAPDTNGVAPLLVTPGSTRVLRAAVSGGAQLLGWPTEAACMRQWRSLGWLGLGLGPAPGGAEPAPGLTNLSVWAQVSRRASKGCAPQSTTAVPARFCGSSASFSRLPRLRCPGCCTQCTAAPTEASTWPVACPPIWLGDQLTRWRHEKCIAPHTFLASASHAHAVRCGHHRVDHSCLHTGCSLQHRVPLAYGQPPPLQLALRLSIGLGSGHARKAAMPARRSSEGPATPACLQDHL
jgi:hypothetical protein